MGRMAEGYRDEQEAAFAAVSRLRDENAKLAAELDSLKKRLRAVERAAGVAQPAAGIGRPVRLVAGVVCGLFVAGAAAGFVMVRRPAAAAAPEDVRSTEPAISAPAAQPAQGTRIGYLSVVCLPTCDEVYDNDQLLGAAPIFRRSTAVGRHQLRLVLKDPPSTKTVSVLVTPDTTATVRETMEGGDDRIDLWAP